MEQTLEPLRTPCQVNLELTSACNHHCPYCYNYWRHDARNKPVTMSKATCDLVMADLTSNKVLNVILSGGEPFLNYDVLLHAVRELTRAGIMTTCNTNLTLATNDQLKALKDAGLPHILTSLASYDPVTNDRVFNDQGSFEKIVRNITLAVQIGIKISINNIITIHNKDCVYQTGRLAAALGASNYFVTRAVVSRTANNTVANEALLASEDYIQVLDAAVRVRDETGIAIYSLYQYPLCMIKDVEKYREFVGRGCPAGKKMVCINANGDIHACNHETESYGNVLTTGIAPAWARMKKWRDGSLVPEDCKTCKWYPWCEGGCRMAAAAINQPDYLCQGSAATKSMPDPVADYVVSLPRVTDSALFRVKHGLRYREETGFWLVHLLGSWITRISPQTAAFLMHRDETQPEFRLQDFPGSREALARLVTKHIVEIVA